MILGKNEMNTDYYSNLRRIYLEVTTKIYKANFRKFSLSTVNNYILNFDKLMETDKEHVYTYLVNYLNLIKEIEEIKILEAMELYKKSLGPIEKYYSKIGFIIFIPWKTIIYFALPITLVLIIFKAKIIVFVIFYLFMIILKIRTQFMSRKNKTYGPFH